MSCIASAVSKVDSVAFKLEILYEDNYLYVLNKPALIHSTKLAGSKNLSIAELLIKRDPNLLRVAPKTEDAGLVQRLDFETSGALIAAKTRAIWETLYQELQGGSIEKSYLALVEGKPNLKDNITTFIGSPNRNAKKVKVYKSKPAKRMRALQGSSHFERLNYSKNFDMSLVRIHASPARRHQVRAHAAFLKHTLVGDTLYGSTKNIPEELRASQPFLLHAEMVAFVHPVSKKQIRVMAPIPFDLNTLFAKFS